MQLTTINEVTRLESENILDLVLTSNPSLIINTSVAPGMSDHDAVTFQLNLKPLHPRKPPHKVYSYNLVNWEELHSELSSLSQAYFARNPNDISLNSNWLFLKHTLQDLMKKHISHCMSRNKPHLPYITKQIKRLMHKRDKSHAKSKKKPTNQN